MIVLPFIYFLIFTLITYNRKKNLDVSVVVLTLYTISCAFAIVIDEMNLYDGVIVCRPNQFSLWMVFLFCFLHTVVLYPLTRLDEINVNNIFQINSSKLLNLVIFTYSMFFIIIVFFYFDNILLSLIAGDELQQLKSQLRFSGENAFYTKYNGILGIITKYSLLLGECSNLLLVIFFYNLCFNPYKKTLLFFSFLATLCSPVIGIISFDRSKILYWFFTFIIMYVFFKSAIPQFIKRKFYLVVGIFSSFFIFYFVIVTVGRFSESEYGSINGIIIYAGQSFTNFCYILERVTNGLDQYGRSFPFLNSVFDFSNNLSDENLSFLYFSKKNMFVFIFSTYIGTMVSESGIWISIIYCFFVSFFIFLFKRMNNLYFYKLLIYFSLVFIPYLGIFINYYGGNIHRFLGSLIIILIFYIDSKIKM